MMFRAYPINKTSIDAIYSYFLAVSPDFMINAGFQASYVHRFLKTAGYDPARWPGCYRDIHRAY